MKSALSLTLMKSAVSLTLIVCLVASALPVTAQERKERAGSLARATTIETVRLAAAGETVSSSVDAVQRGGTPAESNWSRVRGLAPGTEVIVTVHGSQPGTRYVVLADESELTVLNLTDPKLPAVARDALHDVATHHPEYFPRVQKGGQFVLDKNVRVGPDGVFMADRKVADLGQVIENIARNDVAEISALAKPVWSSVERGARIGAWAGLATGAVALAISANGGSQCGSGCNIPTGLAAPLVVFGGAAAGRGIGAIIGAVGGATRAKTQDVIYRAP